VTVIQMLMPDILFVQRRLLHRLAMALLTGVTSSGTKSMSKLGVEK
jgi:hypothetical protein